jgi:LytS/YehU family sensor histidine kinase
LKRRCQPSGILGLLTTITTILVSTVAFAQPVPARIHPLTSFWLTWGFRSILVIVFAAFVIVFFKFRENRMKKEQVRQISVNKQMAELRLMALRGQMNPRFIFNSLNSIQHFIASCDKEEALNYLSKFSKLIRKILENSRQNNVSVSNEFQSLELYMQLQQLRFNNKFDFHIEIDQSIDQENTEIPAMLIQPYVEKAILDGLINKNEKGDLWVSLERNKELLVCKIEDNGIGRKRARELKERKVSKHKLLGIEVTEDRSPSLFAGTDNTKVVVEDLFETGQTTGSASQPAGTRVTISIPYKEDE